MTVCIGSIFLWNYAPAGQPVEQAHVLLAISDRMITAGDAQYEPLQQKQANLAPNIIALIAGDYTVSSQAVKVVQAQLKNRQNATVHDAATLYGIAIQTIHRKAAEDLYLAPLGLNTDGFLAQQKDMAHSFIETITHQLQQYEGAAVEALVMGMSGDRPHLYEIDRFGTVRCYDDVGFAAIGIGATHARSTMMQAGFVNMWTFGPALAVSFAAKKAAETAPGVGKSTDVTIMFKDHYERLRPDIAEKMEKIYTEYSEQRRLAVFDAIKKTEEALRDSNSPPPGAAAPAGNPAPGGGNNSGQGAIESAENAASETQ